MSKRNSNKPIIPSEKIFVGYPKKSQFFEDNRNYEEQKMSPKKVEFDKILKKQIEEGRLSFLFLIN